MDKIRFRQLIKISIDLLLLSVGIIISFFMKYDLSWSNFFNKTYLFVFLTIFLYGYFYIKMYKQSWSKTSGIDIAYILSLNLFMGIIFAIDSMAFETEFPKHLIVLIVILSSSSQLLIRLVFKTLLSKNENGKFCKGSNKRCLIIGAGRAGEILVREGKKNPKFNYEILGYLDDDDAKQNVKFYGFEVLGRIDDMAKIAKDNKVDSIILAIPSASKQLLNKINEMSHKLQLDLKILPSIEDILLDKSLTKQIRDVSIEDLLGRDQIDVNTDGINDLIEGETVVITGGAGSIGSELSRQIAKYKPKKLINIDINENAIYFLELELKRKYPNLEVVSEICNVREKEKVELLFKRYKPSIVFHAAAHKHVPLMEHNPEEAIKNNIFGTKNVIDVADKYRIEKFVLISTDKAVNPTNIMGATKRACEIILQEKSKTSSTKFMAVRFGNVLGSNGSVIPIFKKLIEEGKNLTLTHKDITRYFMTIPEAAQLVIEAGTIGSGGEVFILDMGKPVKIIDLARKLIDLSNAEVDIDIIGLRPGEKLYEELLYDVNSAMKTENKKIFISRLGDEKVSLHYHLERLRVFVKSGDKNLIKEEMKRLVLT